MFQFVWNKGQTHGLTFIFFILFITFIHLAPAMVCKVSVTWTNSTKSLDCVTASTRPEPETCFPPCLWMRGQVLQKRPIKMHLSPKRAYLQRGWVFKKYFNRVSLAKEYLACNLSAIVLLMTDRTCREQQKVMKVCLTPTTWDPNSLREILYVFQRVWSFIFQPLHCHCACIKKQKIGTDILPGFNSSQKFVENKS